MGSPEETTRPWSVRQEQRLRPVREFYQPPEDGWGAIYPSTMPSGTGVISAICPDLLRYSQLGVADGWRGRLVRGFFRLLRLVTGV